MSINSNRRKIPVWFLEYLCAKKILIKYENTRIFFFLRINVYDMNIATSIIVKISQKILGCTCFFETFKSYPHSPLYKIVKI